MAEQVLVVGLGRFGAAVARELESLGHEVLGVDADEATVNEIAPELTHALQLDARDEVALRAAGAPDFEIAVVAISSDAEASIFATTVLKNLGVGHVVSKAGSRLHGDILARIGADRVVFPEREMGVQVARSISQPNVLEYLEVGPGYGVERMRVPGTWVGRTVGELDLAGRHGVRPLLLRRGRDVLASLAASQRLEAGDEIVVAGPDTKLAKLRG